MRTVAVTIAAFFERNSLIIVLLAAFALAALFGVP
jgi:hypothetical protein